MSKIRYEGAKFKFYENNTVVYEVYFFALNTVVIKRDGKLLKRFFYKGQHNKSRALRFINEYK
jgi:hypothetical protein